MKLYEINNAMLNCIDSETGEVIDINRLNELQIAKEEKIEQMACWFKNITAEANALKAERQALEAREKQANRISNQIKEWLSIALNGSKLSTSKVSLSFRKSEQIELDDVFDIPSEYINTIVETRIDKIALKKAIKDGATFKGCRLIEKQNLQIK